MHNDRFLLINPASDNFWENIHRTIELLLLAELTERIPVIFWRCSAEYNDARVHNAFDMYFEPVSPYSMYDLMRTDYTFYPPVWNCDNIITQGLHLYHNAEDIIYSDANVVVSDRKTPIIHVQIPNEHPVYGMTPLQSYRYLFDKYLTLKLDIQRKINNFFDEHLRGRGPLLAVHIPHNIPQKQSLMFDQLNKRYHNRIHKVSRSDRFQVNEVLKLHEVVRFFRADNTQQHPSKLYHSEIREALGRFNIRTIFLATDSEEIVEECQQLYGSTLKFTIYNRDKLADTASKSGTGYLNNRNEGIQILMETYLASKCDFFIGCGYSYLSHMITRSKVWPETNYRLMYWLLEKLYNFSYEELSSGRYTPEESEGKYALIRKQIRNTITKIQRVFK